MDHVINVSAPRDSPESRKIHLILGGKLMFQMSKAHARHHRTGSALPSQLQSRILNVLQHQFTLTSDPDPVLRGG